MGLPIKYLDIKDTIEFIKNLLNIEYFKEHNLLDLVVSQKLNPIVYLECYSTTSTSKEKSLYPDDFPNSNNEWENITIGHDQVSIVKGYFYPLFIEELFTSKVQEVECRRFKIENLINYQVQFNTTQSTLNNHYDIFRKTPLNNGEHILLSSTLPEKQWDEITDIVITKDDIRFNILDIYEYCSQFEQVTSEPSTINELVIENYITLNEAIAYLSKSLDLSVINPINFLERNIKQGLIIPYFEFIGFIQFETKTDKFSTVIQIDEVHGFFKDFNYSNPNDQFSNLSKDTYSLEHGGKIEKLFYSTCAKFYGRYYSGEEHYEPNEAMQPLKDMAVSFYSLMPAFREYNNIVRGNNDTQTLNKNAIHFKISELENLANQNPHLKSISQGQQLTDQTAQLQAEIDRLTAENQQLKERLESQPTAEPIVDNSNSRSQDDKLIVAMALLLAEKSKLFTRANKPNAEQIGIAVTGIADYLLEKEDKYGLTTPAQRIRTALKNTIELIKK